MIKINRQAAFCSVLANEFFRPGSTLTGRLAHAASLMPSTPSFAQTLHVSVEDREQSVFGTAMTALSKTCVVRAQELAPIRSEW